ncbi:5-amino-6-(5-phospho-D-ribitylamino)uracil phosphatase YbjI [Andreprevotia sp. IGB-42]|uniref:Cof-type HAD-IIB family hydrolase n=1 Tax=Andreprevotia sp. IGB-42 TaxID=2497473 RepID=UPI001359FCB6|nr:Cof-type HAD-IIB family hydrolase [Andreprevotia sp. IGB-42]KAF0811394.1 5-amino-6-(5-phospho-D-ribitylamino)uracil phosphatase YbjI [Andreprevotia sp. IGB-42]
MPVKLIAVDMDGTFLRSGMTYDRARFAAQYAQLQQAGVKFVVASGNQYAQLQSFFPDIARQIAFVAENGAYVVEAGQPLFVGAFVPEAVARILAVLDDLPVRYTVCGKHSAYMHTRFADDYFASMQRYYHRLQRVADYRDIDDTVFKFALDLSGDPATDFNDDQLQHFMATLEQTLNASVKPVSSGHGSVDLIIPGVHKASGLRRLQQRWGIADSEVLAFGDGGNDLEMLAQAGFGYAMANGSARVKQVARYQAGSNNDDAVLDVIDLLLARQAPFA